MFFHKKRKNVRNAIDINLIQNWSVSRIPKYNKNSISFFLKTRKNPLINLSYEWKKVGTNYVYELMMKSDLKHVNRYFKT